MRLWATLDANGRVTGTLPLFPGLDLTLFLIAFQKAGGKGPKKLTTTSHLPAQGLHTKKKYYAILCMYSPIDRGKNNIES